MTIPTEMLVLIVGIVSVIIAYILMRLQIAQKLKDEAKALGKLEQRVDTLEETLDKVEKRHNHFDDRIGKHDTDIGVLCKEIEGLHEIVVRIDEKMDKILEHGTRYDG